MAHVGQKRPSDDCLPFYAKRQVFNLAHGTNVYTPECHDMIDNTKRINVEFGRTPEGQLEMKKKMSFILKETDLALDSFITRHKDDTQFQYVDVCCAPGGFSEFVVSNLPNARGFGLSLPPSLGGHTMRIDSFPQRYGYRYMDVPASAPSIFMHNMYRDRSLEDCYTESIVPAPGNGNCDLLIIDGSFLGGKPHVHGQEYVDTGMKDEENPAFNAYHGVDEAHKGLLIAQLIVVANNLKAGGTMLLRLDIQSPDDFLYSVICLLRRVFKGTIHNHKPRSCHAHRGSYYMVCHNYSPEDALRLKFVETLSSTLARLRTKAAVSLPLVPFPHLPEGRDSGAMITVWGQALDVCLLPLFTFRDIYNHVAAEGKQITDNKGEFRLPKKAYNSLICGKSLILGIPCTGYYCKRAHTPDELAAKIKLAWRVRPGVMSVPPSLAMFLTSVNPGIVQEDVAVNEALRIETDAIPVRRARWQAAGVDFKSRMLGSVEDTARTARDGVTVSELCGLETARQLLSRD